ncbi:MAG TPA: hypothetical protein P5022_11755, partial [Candidatus Paceibacterota bacterium]|nr:hypothetical protein [Candidatus Paceibacterota bacterium]
GRLHVDGRPSPIAGLAWRAEDDGIGGVLTLTEAGDIAGFIATVRNATTLGSGTDADAPHASLAGLAAALLYIDTAQGLLDPGARLLLAQRLAGEHDEPPSHAIVMDSRDELVAHRGDQVVGGHLAPIEDREGLARQVEQAADANGLGRRQRRRHHRRGRHDCQLFMFLHNHSDPR